MPNHIDCDILTYGLCCTPCLFGENAYKVTHHPSCVSYALSYSLLTMSAQIIGATLGTLIVPESQFAMSLCALLCSNTAIGMYAGNMRSKIRDTYGIAGSETQDHSIHYLCSPFGVCQEAQEIRYQTIRVNEPYMSKYYESTDALSYPTTPLMEK